MYERFAIPYSFKPRLSLGEAIVAAGAAFLRIFLGSLLFAFWGAYSFATVLKIQNLFLRVAAGTVLAVLFLILISSLMLAISAVERKLRFERPTQP